MDRTGTIASFIVRVIAGVAVTCSTALAANDVTPIANVPGDTAPPPGATLRAPRPRGGVSSDWTLGFELWHEKLEVTRIDQQKFPIESEFLALVGGKEWQARAMRGFIGEVQFFFGQAATQSRDSSLTYFKEKDAAYGTSASFGYFIRGSDLIQGALSAVVTYRHASFTEPDGYTFTPYTNRFLAMARFELLIPLNKSIKLLNQFSAPVTDAASSKSPGPMWLIGLRR